MPHFVYDNTNLDFPKTDLNALPVGADPTQYVVAAEWNRICQASVDIKSQLRGGKFYGLEAQASDPNPSGITNYLWLSNSGILTLEFGASTFQMVPATRAVNSGSGLTGGGALSTDRTLALETLSPTSAGTFINATVTVDIHGRVTGASNGSGSTAQRFIYTRSGGASADFTVSLPIVRASALYGVQATAQGVTSLVVLDIPDADKTTSQFRVLSSANVANGDKIYFVVEDLTA